jgi:protein-tyrosine phosphatase
VHPIDRFSFLCIGSVGAAYNLSELQSAGITHVVCAAASPRIRFPTHFKYLKLEGLRDRPTQDLTPHFEKAFEFIDDVCASGGRVLVHCFKGVSRSAAVVCAYLIVRKNLTLAEALDLVRAARRSVAPNQGFLRQLRAMEEQLRLAQLEEPQQPPSPSSEATTTSSSSSTSCLSSSSS